MSNSIEPTNRKAKSVSVPGEFGHEVPKALEDVIGFLLNELGQIVRLSTGKAMKDLKLNPRLAGMMLVLSSRGPTTPHNLGELLQMDRTSIMLMLRSAEETGMILRKRHPTDARTYFAELSIKGKKIIPEMKMLIYEAQHNFLKSLTKLEQSELQRVLLKLLKSQPSQKFK